MRYLILAVQLFVVAAAPLWAQPTPSERDKGIAKVVVDILQRSNLARPKVDDDFSKRMFQRFIDGFDSQKRFFLKSDIEEFRKFEGQLADDLRNGDPRFAFAVFARLNQRVTEVQKIIDDFLATPVDFSAKDQYFPDAKNLDFCKDAGEQKARIVAALKYDLLVRRQEMPPPEDAESRRKLAARWRDRTQFITRLENIDIVGAFLNSATQCIDPHSDYMSPKQIEDFMQSIQLNLEGIGAILKTEEDTPVVEEIVAGGPAFKDGRLKRGDRIVAVAQGDGNFKEVVGMRLDQAVRLIRGAKGTKVELKIRPNGKTETVVLQLVREKVVLKDAQSRAEILDAGTKPDGKPYRVGMIVIPSFYGDTGSGREDAKLSVSEDVRKFLADFREKKVDLVALDLRGNGGGLLHEAVALTGMFLKGGTVVQVKGFDGKVDKFDDEDEAQEWTGPMAVLTDRLSASASEIFAAAIQDHGRGLVIGDTTFGKGTVQRIVPLGRGNDSLGAVKLTVQFFYRATGTSTQCLGVTPDVQLPSMWQVGKIGERHLECVLTAPEVKAAEIKNHGLITAALTKDLQTRSAERVAKVADLTKLQRQIEKLNAELKNPMPIPLNEDEFKEYRKKRKADLEAETADEPRRSRDNATAFDLKTPVNQEILTILGDYLNLRGK